MDLKQKQASLAEAYYARESARDTARQGKTVIVFTVVTILFVSHHSPTEPIRLQTLTHDSCLCRSSQRCSQSTQTAILWIQTKRYLLTM